MTAKEKRAVFTMGGKGGGGKTDWMVVLAEWFAAHGIDYTLLDLDTENKTRGSLSHYFDGRSHKVNINTPAGLDAFVDYLEDGPRIILADMGAGSGQITAEWFDSMYEMVAASGVGFTAVGVVTPDPASVESLLEWANRLQDRVQYLVVKNRISPLADFRYWEASEPAIRFREALDPRVMEMAFRLAEIENPSRQHGVTLSQISARQTDIPQLRRASLVMRAQSYRKALFDEFDRVKEVLLP